MSKGNEGFISLEKLYGADCDLFDLPVYIVASDLLTAPTLKTYFFMLTRTDLRTLQTKVTRTSLTHYLKLSQDTVDRHLKELMNFNLIECRRRGNHMSNLYYMNKIPSKFIEEYKKLDDEFKKMEEIRKEKERAKFEDEYGYAACLGERA